MNATNPINTINPINSVNPKNLDCSKYFLITIDVEDWFQVENFKPWIPFSTWDSQELRVEQNVHRLLDLFDSIKLPSEKPDTRNDSNLINSKNATNATNPRTPCATFFVLCWIARRLPHLVREIVARGHEVASHGCYHDLLTKIPLTKLKAELLDSRLLLEDTAGKPVLGFRAPSFAVDENILKHVAEAGYGYDSSYNSFNLHNRYGRISLNGRKKLGIAWQLFDGIYEIPISNLNIHGHILPTGGGAYFRIVPFQIFRQAVKLIVKRDNTYMFYLHPWEIDSGQPRLNEASSQFKLRHYSNLSKTEDKMDRLINSFPDCHFTTCTKYLNAAATAQ